MFVLERDFHLCTNDCIHKSIYQLVDWLIYCYVFWLAHKSTVLAEFMDEIDYTNIFISSDRDSIMSLNSWVDSAKI